MAGTSWKVAVNDTGAKDKIINATDWNGNFDWSEGHIVPHIAGVRTDNTYDLGESSYFFRYLYTKSISAFTLGGKLTAGAVEIEGSAFDINGGTIDGAIIGGTSPAAITGTSLTYSSVQTRYYVIPGLEFLPTQGDEQIYRHPVRGYYDSNGQPQSDCVVAVHLPTGAVVTRFDIKIYKTEGSQAIVNLNVKALSGSLATESTLMATDSSTSAGEVTLSDTSISSATIDNDANCYWIYLDIADSNDSIEWAKITYTVTVPLP